MTAVNVPQHLLTGIRNKSKSVDLFDCLIIQIGHVKGDDCHIQMDQI